MRYIITEEWYFFFFIAILSFHFGFIRLKISMPKFIYTYLLIYLLIHFYLFIYSFVLYFQNTKLWRLNT